MEHLPITGGCFFFYLLFPVLSVKLNRNNFTQEQLQV